MSHERQARIPQQEQDLNRNAAIAWLKQKMPHQALRHAQRAYDGELVAEILNEYGWKMFHQGELSTLEAAINLLDKDLLFSDPKLTMLRAWLAQSQHRYNQVGTLLAEAENEHKNAILTSTFTTKAKPMHCWHKWRSITMNRKKRWSWPSWH